MKFEELTSNWRKLCELILYFYVKLLNAKRTL
jgi:hypothetical protein